MDPTADLPPMPFTPESLAERWACSSEHVRTLCRQGRLRSFKVGRGMYRIPQDAVVAFEAEPQRAKVADVPVVVPRFIMGHPRMPKK